MINCKKYSPARIKNPTSIQHMSWLQPGQVLMLELDTQMYPNAKVSASNEDLFEILCVNYNKNENVYFFSIKQKVYEWAYYSNSHISDIWIDSDDVCARVVVMQLCHTPAKSSFITVVNPDCADIRIRPYNIIEVVLFDSTFREGEEWAWEWDQKDKIGIDLINTSVTSMGMLEYVKKHNSVGEDCDEAYSKCLRGDYSSNYWCKQHHFWFRLNGKSTEYVTKDAGLIHVGNLKFFGWGDRYSKSKGYDKELFLSICCKFTSDCLDKVCKTLALTKNYRLDNFSKDYVDRPSVMHHLNYYGTKKYKVKSPSIKDISVELIEFKDIEEGCESISAFMSPTEYNASCNNSHHNYHLFGTYHNRYIEIEHDEFRNVYDLWD